MKNILEKIVDYKKLEVENSKKQSPIKNIERKIIEIDPAIDFKEKLQEKKPGETLKMAVKRMLPGGVFGRKQLTKLKIYSGNDHPHTAQNPTIIELDKLNLKNIVRN